MIQRDSESTDLKAEERKKKAFSIFYYPLFPDKEGGQNHFTKPKARA